MAAAMPRVAFTRIGPTTLGRMWRAMIRALDAPDPRAASTYSFSLMESTWPRTTRAMYIHPMPASTSTMVVLSLPNFFMAMARMAMAGTTRNRSVMRMRTWSENFPKNPAREPRAVPTTVAISATARPIFSEIWPANMISVTWSRPISSVPNQCLAEGPTAP